MIPDQFFEFFNTVKLCKFPQTKAITDDDEFCIIIFLFEVKQECYKLIFKTAFLKVAVTAYVQIANKIILDEEKSD